MVRVWRKSYTTENRQVICTGRLKQGICLNMKHGISQNPCKQLTKQKDYGSARCSRGFT